MYLRDSRRPCHLRGCGGLPGKVARLSGAFVKGFWVRVRGSGLRVWGSGFPGLCGSCLGLN